MSVQDEHQRARVGRAISASCRNYKLRPQKFLGDALHVAGLDLALVGLHDVADDPSDLLDVGDVERRQSLAHETPQRGGVEPARQKALAELDLEAQLSRLRCAPLARLLVLR